MALPALSGVIADMAPPAGDAVNALSQGAIVAVGPTEPAAFRGALNLSIWASFTTALTTVQGSLQATLASAGAVAAGSALRSANVPPGTTVQSIAGTTATLALPTVTRRGKVSNGSTTMQFMPDTTNLLGAVVSGPMIQPSTTVAAILVPCTPGQTNPSGAAAQGSVQLSLPATGDEPTHQQPIQFNFALGPQAIASGTDTAASFTGAGITYTGSVQLERSFDGGPTFIVGNAGGGGSLAVFSTGTPVSASFTEAERNVLYRLNCTSYTAAAGVTLNYRLSETGGAAESLQI